MKNEETTLTTDIATSFWGPFKLFSNIKKSKSDFFGEENNFTLFREPVNNCRELNAFSKVLNTIGNIYTTDHNPGPGNDQSEDQDSTWANDGLDYKLTKIKKYFYDCPYADGKLGRSISKYYKEKSFDFEDFINDHYLNDYLVEGGDIRSILCLKPYNTQDIPKKPDQKSLENYFFNATKLIIQRGYRIHYQYKRNNDGSIKLNCSKKPIINNDLFNKDLSFTDYAEEELKIAFLAVGLTEGNLEIIK